MDISRQVRFRNITASAVALGLLLGLPPSAALAQEEARGVLEEVTVTAQKREENLQELPISITALTADDIKERGIQGVEDLYSSAPGVTGFEAVSTRGNMAINLRGIGSGNPNSLSVDPANAVYVDGVYIGKAMGLGIDRTDLERIEILRGPQGTLYGRNSTGGAINFITRKPAGEFGFEATGTFGDYDLRGMSFRVDTPSFGGLSMSLSGNTRKRDELYGNTNPDSPGFENLDRQGLRFALNWEVSETFTVDYTYDTNELDENTQALGVHGFNPLGAGVLFAPGFPTNVATNSTDRIGAVAQLQGFLPFLGPAYQAPQVQQLDQWMTDYINWATAQLAAPQSRKGGFMGSTDSIHRSTNEVEGHALTLSWYFDAGEFRSITGYRTSDNTNESDIDGMDNTLRPISGSPLGLTTGHITDGVLLAIGAAFLGALVPPLGPATNFAVGSWLVDGINNRGRAELFNTYITAEYEQFSQEFQFVGSTDTLDYAVGLFYFKDEGERGGNSTAFYPLAFSESAAYDNSGEAKSAYAQFTWRPSADSGLELTGGLRYTKEDKKITYLWRNSADPFGFLGPFFRGESTDSLYVPNELADQQDPVEGIYGRKFKQDFSNTSGKVTLAYHFSDTFNAFATYSTGYRSGGFNGDAFDRIDDTADAFDKETIKNWEVGFKSDLWDRRMRLNATYFDYTYDDIQTSTLRARSDGTVTSAIENAGKASRSGLEVEFTVLPTDNLLIGLAYTYMNGDFDEYPPRVAPGGAVLPQSDLAQRALVPDHQVAFNVDWTIAETDWGIWMFNLNGNWMGDAPPIAIAGDNYNTDGLPGNETPVVFEQLENQERTMVNARLSLNEMKLGQNGSLSFGLWGRNLLDEDVRSFSFNFGSAIGLNLGQFIVPRTYGMDITYRYR